MNKNILLYLNDILESIALVEQYVSGVKEEDFSRDKEKQDSVIRRLMIIGEAATRVPKEIRALSPDTQWPREKEKARVEHDVRVSTKP